MYSYPLSTHTHTSIFVLLSMTATTVVYLIFTHIHIVIDALESNVGIAGCVKMSEFGVEELAQ